MLTEGLNGTRCGCRKSSANKRRRKRSRCPKQPAPQQQAGFGGTRTASVLSNSVMPQECGARSALMGDISLFKRWPWKGSLMLEEQETGTDRMQPRCWLLPEKASRVGGQKLKEKTTCICTLGKKCCFHGKTSLCCSHLGHCICVKVYRVHIGKLGLDDGRVNPHLFCFCSALELGGQKEIPILNNFLDKEEKKYLLAGDRLIQVHNKKKINTKGTKTSEYYWWPEYDQQGARQHA